MSKNDSTTFLSPTNELRLVKEPERRRPIGEGGDFINVPGQSVTFRQGRLVVSDSELLEWLRGHNEYGRLFHEQGSEPDRPREDTSGIHALIVELALDGDTDQIADLLVAERSSYSRPDVIAACEKALNRAGDPLPPKPETPEHELERVRFAPAGAPPVEGLEAGESTGMGTPTAEGSDNPVPPSQTSAQAPTGKTFSEPQAGAQGDVTDATDGTGNTAGSTVEAPPYVGKGSDTKAWKAYADQIGVSYPKDASRSDVQALIDEAQKA